MKDLLAYLGLRAGVGLVGVLPRGVVRELGRAFGSVWGIADSSRRTMAKRHLDRVLGNGADTDAGSREMMKAYGRYYAEVLWVRKKRVPEMLAHTEVVGLEHLLEARDAGKGMIYALPHMGNWEAAAPVAIREDIPIVAVAEVLPNRRVTDWFTEMRAEVGIEIVLATGRVEVMRRLEAALGENKAVALLSDRDLNRKGIEVDFFGEKTTMPPGPATLAVRTGAPLFPVGCYFTEGGYRVVVHPALPIPDAKSRSDRVSAATQALAQKLEEIIGVAPDQWHLVVPNWPSDHEAE